MRRTNSHSYLAALGVIGMEPIEPIIIAALITAEPLLLIGPHGTGKSYLLNRVSTALGFECRHYNASLLNFDDLVGYPLPNRKGQLEYVQTPASIWGAQTVFFDEISRCRPDMQNKLFPIIHEKRVQGIDVERLVYRWAAMNPPRNDEDPELGYAGSEPLDTALADRFAFVVEVPSWEQFSERDQELVICSNGADVEPETCHEFRVEIEDGRRLLDSLSADRSAGLAIYVRLLLSLLARAGVVLSPRRAGMILRNVLAVHAANLISHPDTELRDSTLLAVTHSIPQLAQGIKVDRVKLLASHREAWKAAQLNADDPCRIVFMERDPVRRVMKATKAKLIPATDFSGIVADAIATLPVGGRHALAFSLFESPSASRLVAAVAEQCAELYAIVGTPQEVRESVHAKSVRHRVWQHVVEVLARLDRLDSETALKTNLLCGLFSSNQFAVEADVDHALAEWSRVRSSLALPRARLEATA